MGRGILLLWSVWLSVVFSSNLCDALQQTSILPETWRFVSGNFALIERAIGIYALPKAAAVILFAGVLLAQSTGALLFWRAFLDREAIATRHHPKVVAPFSVAMALFGGFLVSDEVFVVYERIPGLAPTHWLVLGALLLSFLTLSTLVGEDRAG